jgi:ribosomal protein L11 methyltransferase
MTRVTEVRVEIPASDKDAAEGLLYLQGADGLAIEDEATGPGEGREPVPPGFVRLLAYFPDGAAPKDALLAYAAGVPSARVSFSAVDPAAYGDRWKAYFKPAKVSERLWVRPSWEELPAPLSEGERVIVIDPGAAFGTGLHETTRQCLKALDRVISPGASLLDVGTGSGILAISGRLFGAGRVLGIDNDPLAVLVAKENCQRNGAADIEISEAPLDAVGGVFDVVAANILTATLVTLKDALLERLAPGGALILAGVLSRELEFVRGAFLEGALLRLEAEDILGEWAGLCFRRPGGA